MGRGGDRLTAAVMPAASRKHSHTPIADVWRGSRAAWRPGAQFGPSAFSSAAVKSLLLGVVVLP